MLVYTRTTHWVGYYCFASVLYVVYVYAYAGRSTSCAPRVYVVALHVKYFSRMDQDDDIFELFYIISDCTSLTEPVLTGKDLQE